MRDTERIARAIRLWMHDEFCLGGAECDEREPVDVGEDGEAAGRLVAVLASEGLQILASDEVAA